MKSLRTVLVLGVLSLFFFSGCFSFKAPETVNIGGGDEKTPKTKSEWKEYGKNYYNNDGDEK